MVEKVSEIDFWIANNKNCHQLHTVALSFLTYAAGKQQLVQQMPKIRHLRQ